MTTVLSAANFQRFFQDLGGKKSLTDQVDYVKWAAGRLAERFRSETTPSTNASGALRDALGRADAIGYVWRLSLDAHIDQAAPPRLNLFIPSIDPGIIFGGYISYFQFAAYCKAAGANIRFVVTERLAGKIADIVARCRTWYPEIADVLERCEIVDYTGGARPKIGFSSRDIIVAYSCATALIAHNTAAQIGLAPIVFYIQEEEGHFHAHNSMRAFLESVYDLPHIAIFNSELLEQYYRQNGIGVFNKAGPPRHIHFRHALNVGAVPTPDELRARPKRKLLFFARPEQHAERNLFELGLVALRRATADNVFPADEWDLHAIGTEKFAPLQLYGGQTLQFIGRFPLSEYSRRLTEYDVGLSMIYTPHPSVPNFEMAASGVVTVTTEFSNRSRAAMEALCPNFVATRADVESIVDGLREAVRRSGDAEARVANAGFDWPRRWSDSFDRDFSARLSLILARQFPTRHKAVLPGLSRYAAAPMEPRRLARTLSYDCLAMAPEPLLAQRTSGGG